jgi:hypothetical protein
MREKAAHFLIGGPIKKYFLGSEIENRPVMQQQGSRCAGRRPGEPGKLHASPPPCCSRPHGSTAEAIDRAIRGP